MKVTRRKTTTVKKRRTLSGVCVMSLCATIFFGYRIYSMNDLSTSVMNDTTGYSQQLTIDRVGETIEDSAGYNAAAAAAETGEATRNELHDDDGKETHLPVLGHRDFPDRDLRRQRIVIMAGPHKAASTTLQSFLYTVAGQTTWIKPENEPETGKKQPHPAFSRWAWPVGIRREFGRDPKTTLSGGGITDMPPAKFHALLASLVTGKAYDTFLFMHKRSETPEAKRRYLDDVSAYFRRLFAVPWREGRNLVIGSEELTSLVMALGGESPNLHPPPDQWAPVAIDGRGEARHVDPHASAMIDDLLRVLPWNATSPGSTLELRDIEVHVNYRTPRIDHAVSVWHQIHNGTTLRRFFATNAKELYVMNSLALALQFVRKGLRTTIVDMTGATAYGKKVDAMKKTAATNGDAGGDDGSNNNNNNNDDDTTVIGGQEGIVACDILRIGTAAETADLPPGRGGPGPNRGFCDDRSRLHLSGYRTAPLDSNRKSDPKPRDLSDEEFARMDDLLREYDCGVWRRLAPYREKGLLRILYASDDLFRGCRGVDVDVDDVDGEEYDDDTEFSFAAVLRELRRMSLAE